MRAYVFPGQGSQFSGMGKDLFDQYPEAKLIFEQANDLLGFPISQVMFTGSEEDLKQTEVTQPAVFLHSVIACHCLANQELPDMVAGHSLGEFSALVANHTLSFEDGLLLVSKRAKAMQRACELNPSGMAVVLKFDNDELISQVCQSIKDEVIVAANFNCPGQVVISGTLKGIELAVDALKSVGASKILPLKVGGAFHSPLMMPAQMELTDAINNTIFHHPICPIYQNATASPAQDPAEIKKNLIAQLTSPVLWTKSIRNMIQNGADTFVEFGPGHVLQGLIKKIDSSVSIQ